MLIAGLGFALIFFATFNALGIFANNYAMSSAAWKIVLIALAAALVEALPIRDIDNITTTGTAALLGMVLF
jgi:hypothetical protein